MTGNRLNPGTKYRADIDGLRAIAVLAVVLFHSGLPHISGGFVGVDVFFVISGYLITALLLEDIRTDRFSIARFYERRARRLLPALFPVLLFTSIAAYRLLLPDDLRDYAASLIGTLTFSSNFVFWRESGYFAQADAVRPLLHTWSLAVEEQFYLIYPWFLVLICRCFRKRYATAISFVLAVSFLANILFVRAHPDPVFYLAPTRIWELLCGALLALQVLPKLSNFAGANIIGLSGLGLIGYSALTFSAATTFPGFNALVPVLGSALVIYGGSAGQTLVVRTLSAKPLVFVGLISYSLYLWHWVLIVFVDYYVTRPLTHWEASGVIGVALLISYLSWRYVETPFRAVHLIRSRTWLFSGAAALACLFSIWGVAVYARRGLPERLTSEARMLISGQDDIWARRDECFGNTCRIGAGDEDPSFLLWGDSHASAIAPVIDQVAQAKHIAGLTALNTGCAPLIGLTRFEGDLRCIRENSSAMDIIRAKHIKNVILHAAWTIYAEGKRYKDDLGDPSLLTTNRRWQLDYGMFEKLLRSTLRELQQLKTNVVLVASVPEIGGNVPVLLERAAMSSASTDLVLPYQEFAERQARTFEILRRLANEYSVKIVYPHELFCPGSNCMIEKDHHALYIDRQHLSVHGAMLLVPLFEKVLDEDLK